MGRALIVLIASFCFCLYPARAGAHDALEPNQVLDIRMEEGVKNLHNTQHGAYDANGKPSGAAFLANQDSRSSHRIASMVKAQKAELAQLSHMLEQLALA